MEFINEVSQSSQNEPGKKKPLKKDISISDMEDFQISMYHEIISSNFESEDEDLVLFGVGGPG